MTGSGGRTIAFLRGMNVGGHRVTMDTLRAEFVAMGLANVETFIASGNVIFDMKSPSSSTGLEQRIEAHLRQALGYEVATFLRTTAELRAIDAAAVFAPADVALATNTIHIGFLRSAPGADVVAALSGLTTSVDRVQVRGQELYWLCRGRSTDTLLKWPQLLRTHRLDVTMRNLKTIHRMVARYAR
jgi:uncharacterized protein (DUF1697 family)